eukprot:443963-Prorocentrum_minimum.AAC.1
MMWDQRRIWAGRKAGGGEPIDVSIVSIYSSVVGSDGTIRCATPVCCADVIIVGVLHVLTTGLLRVLEGVLGALIARHKGRGRPANDDIAIGHPPIHRCHHRRPATSPTNNESANDTRAIVRRQTSTGPSRKNQPGH